MRRPAIRNFLQILLLFILSFSTGCNMPAFITPEPQVDSAVSITPEGEISTAVPLPPPPQTEITFQVQLPENSPPDQLIFLTILDEVTGLSLNAESNPMQPEETGDSGHLIYSITLPFPLGSIIQYRYERQAEIATVGEYISDDRPVRYRVYHVEGPGKVEDVISRWMDTEMIGSTGRISGKVTDSETGEGVPQMLVAAGGGQTLTSSDGSYLLEGLPPGVHNLVAFALDGSYRTFQQGALVAAESTTPAPISLTRAARVNVIFVVSLPEGSPPAVPVRIAGNLVQFGNTFANLAGGASTIAVRMPVLTPLPDGRYTLTIEMPAGAYLNYKYTLGDGFFNAEHDPDGAFQLRHVVIPEENVLIEDQVNTWSSSSRGPLTFDVSVPANTPPEDQITIQFKPVYGWTEPIPMWKLSETRWAYVLYSPLNLPGDLNYRYCRNSQCGIADDIETPGPFAAGRLASIGAEPQKFVDEVKAWAWLGSEVEIPQIDSSRMDSASHFGAGIEFEAAYHPSWLARMPFALDDVRAAGAQFVFLAPTWTYIRNSQPVLAPVAGQDPLWYDLVDIAQQSELRSVHTVLFPQPNFRIEAEEWWQTAPRDFGWWLVWFEQYRTFVLHHADLANDIGSAGLVLGGEWLAPALPGGRLPDGSPSGVPADAEQRWRDLIAEIRSRYNGSLQWALPYASIQDAPAFMDAVDTIYLLFNEPLASEAEASSAQMALEAGRLLDNGALPIYYLFDKPILVATSYPSAYGSATGCIVSATEGCAQPDKLSPTLPDQTTVGVDLVGQMAAYDAVLTAVSQRNWLNGVIIRGYYPPAAIQYKSASVHGTPAEAIIRTWFGLLAPPPAP
jgi:hypothetical protein